MKIIFLDIDGVLNAHEPLCPLAMCGKIHPDKMQLLNHILLKTGAKIVLSSAWRYIVHRGECNLTGINWLFRSHGLPVGAIIDITREDTMVEREYWDGSQSWPVTNERGQQITDWLALNIDDIDRDTYVCIDDLDLGITAAGHPFVQTDGKVGLTEQDAQRAIEILTT